MISACISCHNSSVELGTHRFQTVVGKTYEVYFCAVCYYSFSEDFKKLSPPEQVDMYQKIAAFLERPVPSPFKP